MRQRLTFRQLEAFRAVMLAGSVGKAAEMLSVSQPAVSRLVSDLEGQLGLELFARIRGRLVPTPEAELLLHDAQTAFAGLDMVSEAAAALRTMQRGRIRVVCETVFAEGYLPRLVARYQREHPEVAFELDIGPSARVANWVATRWYDVGLVVLPVAEPEVSVQPHARHEALCVLHSGHELSRRETIAAEDLAGQMFVSLVSGSPFRSAIDQVFDRARVARTIRTEARTQHGICAFVAEGGGVSLVDPCVAEDMRDPRLVFRPFRPAIAWDIAVLMPAARAPSLVARDFAAFLGGAGERASRPALSGRTGPPGPWAPPARR